MIAEAIQKLEDLIARAIAPIKFDVDERRKQFIFNDGRIIEVFHQRESIVRLAGSLDSFIEMVKSFKYESTVLVYCDHVECIINDDLDAIDHGRDRISLAIPVSRFGNDLPHGKAMTQKQLLSYLRNNCESDSAKLLAASIRQVQWSRRSDGTATIDRGKESLGRSVESKVQAAAEIPENMVFTEQLISLPGFVAPYAFNVLIDIDAEEQMFRINLAPGCLEKAQVAWMETLVGYLREALAADGVERIYAGG